MGGLATEWMSEGPHPQWVSALRASGPQTLTTMENLKLMSFGIPVVSAALNLFQTLSTPSVTSSPASLPTSASSTPSTTDPFSNLNLTDTQKQQVQQVINDLQNGTIAPSLAQSQLNAILTPD